MIPYAPSWLRRWRRVLTPILVVAGVASFVMLLALPPFEQSVVPHFLAIILGVPSWAMLMLLLNGEPLPRVPDFASALLNPRETVEFVVRHDQATVRQAREEFWLRSVRELRFGSTVIAPIALALFATFTFKISTDKWVAVFFAGFAVLAIVAPLIMFFLIRRAAAEQVHRFPKLSVRVGREGIAVGTSTGNEALAWSNFVRLWESETNLTLVLNPYMAVQLPKADVPSTAHKLIVESIPAARGP